MVLSRPLIIGLAGGYFSGKTTIAEYLQKAFNFQRVSLAEPLKELAMRITPDGQIDKARDRELLQFLGTDYFRKKIDVDHWAKIFALRARHVVGAFGKSVINDDLRFHTATPDDPDGDNELRYLKSIGGFFVNVIAPPEVIEQRAIARDGVFNKGIVGHASEKPLDPNHPGIDYTIHNDGTVEELFQKVQLMLDSLCTRQLQAA